MLSPPCGDRARGDARHGFPGQRVIVLALQAQHRDLVIEQLVGDQRAQRQDILGLAKHQSRRGAPGKGQPQKHAAAGAGSAAGRHQHHPPGEVGAALRMQPVDDHPGLWMYTAPEAEAFVADQNRSLDRSGYQHCRHRAPLPFHSAAVPPKRRRRLLRAALEPLPVYCRGRLLPRQQGYAYKNITGKKRKI